MTTTKRSMPQLFYAKDEKNVECCQMLLINEKQKLKEKYIDVIETAVGQIGKWQLKIYMFMIVILAPSSWVDLGIELFAHQTEFWCKDVIQHNNEDNKSNYAIYNKNNLNDVCKLRNGSKTPCPFGFQYDTSLVGTTIISDWNLVCDKQYLINIIQIVIMFGALLGAIVFGIAADKYGRRITLLISCILRFFCGILSAFATNVFNFTVLRCILAFVDGGIPAISLMMCVEILGGKWRILLSILLQVGFNIGFPLMAVVTYVFKNWRYAQIVLSLISFSSILCSWIMPESPRWLLAIGETQQAVNILEKAAKENKRNPTVVKKIVLEFEDKSQENNPQCSWWFLFKTPQLRRRTFLACINGTVIFIIINGFCQYFGEFSNNPFFDLTLQGLSGIVGAIIAAGIVMQYNQKHTIAFMSFLVAICSCLILWFSEIVHIRSILSTVVLCALGVCNVYVTVAVIEPLIGELFPTILRNSGYGVFSVFSSVGTIVAPIIILLGDFYWYLPLTTFFILALLEIVFILILPENRNQKLAETVDDIECNLD
ncbi:hypothetical protein RN001_006549 [Aquatica leii]|uniref:Major facilitator superfamily (MFS) profile domain-containing protein n=1 Tax=Aquatica leii TaxID=1421715 RepID=A0AAN7SS98_9COLE|nr:hypothetical protein RN001_006549 [Aquatica leii]